MPWSLCSVLVTCRTRSASSAGPVGMGPHTCALAPGPTVQSQVMASGPGVGRPELQARLPHQHPVRPRSGLTLPVPWSPHQRNPKTVIPEGQGWWTHISFAPPSAMALPPAIAILSHVCADSARLAMTVWDTGERDSTAVW